MPRKTELKILQTYAFLKKGKLISTTYINNYTNVEWECEYGHRFLAPWANIKHFNNWCYKCRIELMKSSMSEINTYIEEKGGKLLTEKYINAHQKLELDCGKGHIFYTTWNHLKSRNQWCPKCLNYKSEHKCIKLAEQIFNLKFEKTRIFYDKNKFLEFDGYNKDYKIAIEYNGIQHYEKSHIHNIRGEGFEVQQLRDNRKKQYCKDNNIKLIIIPYNVDMEIALKHSKLILIGENC